MNDQSRQSADSDARSPWPQRVERVVADDSRRAVLRGLNVLDTPNDPDFDRLTTLAALLLDAPVALVTLVDQDRQWFRAATGTDITETPARMSFCAHAIADDTDVMIVEDAELDSRFAVNELVTGEQHVRFYVGVPIQVSGAKVGTLCVLDRKPRAAPGPEVLEQLKMLAALGSSLFTLKEGTRTGRIAHAALVREEQRHALALEAASIASWVWDVRTDVVECDALLPVLLNLPHARRFNARDLYFQIDRRDVTDREKRLSEALTASDEYTAQYRVAGLSPPRWLSARGRVIERNDDGSPALVFGVHFDITEMKAADDRQRLLLRELNHRVKNTLATVQALASQTVRHASNPREFLAAFSGRLQALGAAHGVLSDREWLGIGLLELVRLEIRPFDDDTRRRVVTSGPDVFLSADQAVALGLVLHELASNALKYGALSVSEGKVDLFWRLDREQADKRLVITWREHGGPHVTQPEKEGFGSILIRRSLAKILSSTVTHEYRPEGVAAEISMVLDESAA